MLIKTKQDLYKMVAHLSDQESIGLDTETTGLNFVRKKLVTIQLSSPTKQFLIDVRDPKWCAIVMEALKPLLESRDIAKIIQNSAFDCSFFAFHHDIWIVNIIDTKLMEVLILGVIPDYSKMSKEMKNKVFPKYSTSLKHILIRYKLARLEKETATSFLTLGDGELTPKQITYALNDVKFFHKLVELQFKKIKKLKLEAVAKLENECAEATYAMRVNGINFDKKYWLDLADKNEAELAKIFKKLNSLTKNQVKNWNSPDQVKKYFASAGIMITSFGDLLDSVGNVAAAYKDVKDKAFTLFIDMRKHVYKYATTYGRDWLTTEWDKKTERDEPTIGPDGRIHCDLNQIINTGRFSCSKPNLQQLPNNNAHNILHTHRKAFIPSKGYKFVISDFTGQELALMASGSNETIWINAMLEGKDIHSVMAELMYGDVWKKGTKKDCYYKLKGKKCNCPEHKSLRHYAKTLNFGLAYGKGAKSLADDLGVSRFEAKDIIRRFHLSVPTLSEWNKENAEYAVAWSESYTLAPFFRRRSLELEDEDWKKKNQGMNTPIQGSGADMIKMVMVRAYREIRDENLPARLLLPVHDELLTEAKSSFAEEWKDRLANIMEECAMVITKHKLIKADPVISTYWPDKMTIDQL